MTNIRLPPLTTMLLLLLGGGFLLVSTFQYVDALTTFGSRPLTTKQSVKGSSHAFGLTTTSRNGFMPKTKTNINECATSLMELSMAQIGIFFGTSTGSTQDVADMLAEEFGDDVAAGPFDIEEIAGNVQAEFAKHDALVVGTPTWNTGADTERSGTGWDEIYYGEMEGLNLSGKQVAVFGLGDQISYAENYADATGELHDVFEGLGCKMMGYTSQEGYEHEESKSIRGDKFCGLLCDAVNQDELTGERVKAWVEQLISEGILEGGGGGGAATAAAVEEQPAPTPAVAAAPTATLVADPPAPVANGAAQIDLQRAVAELEAENARLRDMMEAAGSNGMGVPAGVEEDGGYVPYTNSQGKTMWVSPDGRSCYYT